MRFGVNFHSPFTIYHLPLASASGPTTQTPPHTPSQSRPTRNKHQAKPASEASMKPQKNKSNKLHKQLTTKKKREKAEQN